MVICIEYLDYNYFTHRQIMAGNILPKFYLITPDFDGNTKNYLQSLERSLVNGVKLVQLRSKNLEYKEYKVLAREIIPLVHQYGGKIILNQSIQILGEMDVDGIHLPSLNLEVMHRRSIPKKYIFSASCHNKKQLQQAENLEADLIVLCPIFKTPSSPRGKALGWDKFKNLTENINIPVYALGGVKPSDYQKAYNSGAYGISAIRSLWKIDTSVDLFL